MKSIRDFALRGKRLFLRVDFNVPLDGGRVSDDTRILETLPTVRLALDQGARVLCASHLGKAKGKRKPELSLAPVAVRFAELLGRPVRFVDDCVGPEAAKAADALAPGEVLLLENLRFHAGEEANDPQFAAAARRPRRRLRGRRVRSRAPGARVGRRRSGAREGERGRPPPRERGPRAVAPARARASVRRDPRRSEDLRQDRHAARALAPRRRPARRRRHGEPFRAGAGPLGGPIAPRGGQGAAGARDPRLLQAGGKDDRASLGFRRGEIARRRGGREDGLDQQDSGRPHGARHRAAHARAIHTAPRPGEDDLLERPHGSIRKAAVRRGHDGRREDRRGLGGGDRRGRRRERAGGACRGCRREVHARLDRRRRVARVPRGRARLPGIEALEA